MYIYANANVLPFNLLFTYIKILFLIGYKMPFFLISELYIVCKAFYNKKNSSPVTSMSSFPAPYGLLFSF